MGATPIVAIEQLIIMSGTDTRFGPAILFTPNSGDHAGKTFLVVDGNGDGACTAGSDYVFLMGPSAVIDSSATGIFV